MALNYRLIFILVFLISKISNAQIQSPYNFKYKTYTTEHGLSHNYVKKCMMDSKGYLWLLTLHGISKFDGVSFRNYYNETNNKNSMPFNEANDLIIDNNDNVWLAFKTCLYRFNVVANKFTEIKRNEKSLRINKLAYDTITSLLYCVNYDGYYKINTNNLSLKFDEFIEKEPNELNGMGEILVDSRQKLWIPYFRSGYHCIETKNNKQYKSKEHLWPLSFTETKDNSIYMNCWMQPFIKIVANNNLHLLERHQYPTDFYYTSIIYHSCVANKLTGDSILWLNNTQNGIWLFNKNTNKFVATIPFKSEFVNGMPEAEPNYFYEDKFGNFWICTWRGLVKVNPNEQQFQSRVIKHFDFRLYNLISGIVDDPFNKNVTWISVHGAGLFKMNKKDNSIIEKYFYELSKNNNPNEDINYDRRWLKNMFIDNEKAIWSPTYGGLVKVKNGEVSFVDIRYNKRICYLNYAVSMRSNYMLLASDIGLLKLNPMNNTHSYIANEIAIDGKSIDYTASTICKVDSTTAIVGTENGLLQVDIKSNKLTRIHLNINGTDSLTLNQIRSLVFFNNTVYMGTMAGLATYNLKNNKTKLIGRDKNIDAIYINSLLMDKEQKLWIYSYHALYCYDTKSEIIYKYTKNDGIYNLANDGNVMFEYNNKFYVGFRKSYTEFDPLQVNKSSAKNKPHISSILINEKPLYINYSQYTNNYYELNYKQNEIKINFTALDYTYPDKIVFSVKLEGLDEKWRTITDSRNINFNNLAPGKYKLLIKSATSAGLWNEDYQSFWFFIKPAFWQTWWFKIITIMSLIFGIYYFVKQHIKNIKTKASIKQQMTELEMQAFKSQMNPHFIFNSLHSIHNYIWDKKPEDASEYLVKFSKLIRKILEFSNEKVISLQEEVETLKLYIDLEHRRSNPKFSYHIEDNTNCASKIFIPPLIFQPFVENAIWHGLCNLEDGNGSLTIELNLVDDILICIIDDNGVGRKTAADIKKNTIVNNKSYGLEITSKRILKFTNDLEDAITIIDKTQGTTIILKLPIKDGKDNLHNN